LTALDVRDEVEYVIDINPYRHGRFLPCVGKQIMPPRFLKRYKPDVTLVMNPIYRDEIMKMVEGIGVNTELIPVE
jgi:hypothetical protein